MDTTLGQALQSSAHWLMVGLTLFTVVGAVMLHYGCLNWLNQRLPRFHVPRRRRVLFTISMALLAHAVEIWLFGIAFWLAVHNPALGELTHMSAPNLLQCVYFSAATFTTVGYGEIAPVGPIQFLAGTEALTGFVLITWSASFTYLEMQRDWSN